MEKSIKLFILGFLFLVVQYHAHAQDVRIANPGPKGMYIYIGPYIASPENPVDGITGYKVERRETNSARWETVTESSAPATIAQFRMRYSESRTMFPGYTLDQFVDIDEAWELAIKYRNMDSLVAYSSVVPLHLALGTMIVDEKVRKGREYQYRVFLRKNNSWEPFLVSEPRIYQLPEPEIDYNVLEKTELQNNISFQLAIYPRSGIVLIQTHRRANFAGSFTLINPETYYRFQSDTLVLMVTERNLETNTAYEYTFRAYDFFGNAFQLQDTLFTRTFSELIIQPPYDLLVRQMNGVEGNVLSWKLDQPGRIANVSIYRSLDFDGDYSKIGDASPADSMFIDERTDPMTHYWYFFELTDITGGPSVRSAKIFGRYESRFHPNPPGNLTGVAVEGGVTLSWNPEGEYVRGYYVYRKLPNEVDYQLISNLLQDTTFTDKSTALAGNQAYHYAVQSENTSFLKSNLSNPVSLFPGIKSIPLSPGGLQLIAEPEYIRIMWEPSHNNDPSVQGYLVFRREGDNPAWEQISTFPALINHYNDSLVNAGAVYEYTVRAVDFRGTLSEITTSVKHYIPYQGRQPGPPADIKASLSENSIVITWESDSRSQVMGYKIYRKVTGKPFELLKIIDDPMVYQFNDSAATPGNLYIYQIVSFDQRGVEGIRSKSVAVWF